MAFKTEEGRCKDANSRKKNIENKCAFTVSPMKKILEVIE